MYIVYQTPKICLQSLPIFVGCQTGRHAMLPHSVRIFGSEFCGTLYANIMYQVIKCEILFQQWKLRLWQVFSGYVQLESG
jgi:hypothetical protein